MAIPARQKRVVIYDTLVRLPRELSRMVAEYGISAWELIEEYAMRKHDYDYKQTVLYENSKFSIILVWIDARKNHSINFRVRTNNWSEGAWYVDNLSEQDDLIETLFKSLGWNRNRQIKEKIMQMLESVMVANQLS